MHQRTLALNSRFHGVKNILIAVVIFLAGILLLVKGSDILVDGAGGLASRYGVSPATIGLTVVAFGTSLPELVVTAQAFRLGDYAIGTGNVIGSNIVNIGLVLALVFVFMPTAAGGAASRSHLRTTGFLALGAAGVFLLFSLRGTFDLFSGIIFLAIFSLMIFWMWKTGAVVEAVIDPNRRHPVLRTLAGLVMVVAGAPLLLSGAISIAEAFSIPSSVIGLTMVAIGTSLPELTTSIIATMRKSHGVAVGNIVGSNIFNLLFVIGLNSLVFSIPAPEMKDTLVMIGFSVAVIPLFISNSRMARLWGGLLFCAYIIYVLRLYGVV